MDARRWVVATVGMLVLVLVGAACGSDDGDDSGGDGDGYETLRVPDDYDTIQAAVDAASAGDLVLVDEGTYHETVTVAEGKDDIVIRGVDRNEVIIDGEFERENGVFVVGANGVAVENLTSRNHTENGVFWTDVEGYRGSYLTAYNNRQYGVYAFNSTKGQFDNSYASGHHDSGFYIGQCQPCDAVITDVTAETNMLGYSGTNAGGELYIVNSTWQQNRAGIVPNSLDSEELAPQRSATIVGNVVRDNNNLDAPDSESFGIAFGNGIIVAGGIGNVVERNLVEDHQTAGIAVVVFLDENLYPAMGNRVVGNSVSGSGVVDLALQADVDAVNTPEDPNCVAENEFSSSAPEDVEAVAPCEGEPTAEPAGTLDLNVYLEADYPDGPEYQDVPPPPDQDDMPDADSAPPRPATDVPVQVDVDSIEVPSS